MVFPAMSHFLSVEIRFAPLVVYDYSRLYILGLSSFILEMCIRHTEYIYMVCNSRFHASNIQSYEMGIDSLLIGQQAMPIRDRFFLFDEIVLRMLLS